MFLVFSCGQFFAGKTKIWYESRNETEAPCGGLDQPESFTTVKSSACFVWFAVQIFKAVVKSAVK